MSLFLTSTLMLAQSNTGHLVRRLTFLQEMKLMGFFGIPILFLMLVLTIGGIILIFLRPHSGARLGYSILCLLPTVFGLMGMLSAFRGMFASLTTSGINDTSTLMGAFSEISKVFAFGLFVSAFTMSIAIIVWMMPKREQSAPPQRPIE